jgi:hypothetical protein
MLELAVEESAGSASSIAGFLQRLLKMLPNKGGAQAWLTIQPLDKASGVRWDRADHRANQAGPGRKAIPDDVARMVRAASRVRRASLVLKAKPDRTAKRAFKASRDRRGHVANKACAASKARAAKRARAVRLDHQANCPPSNR